MNHATAHNHVGIMNEETKQVSTYPSPLSFPIGATQITYARFQFVLIRSDFMLIFFFFFLILFIKEMYVRFFNLLRRGIIY